MTKIWVGDNFLKLNENKTEVNLFGSPHLLDVLTSNLGPLQANICTHVNFDSELKFNKEINSVIRANLIFQLRGLWKLKSFLCRDNHSCLHFNDAGLL